MCIRDRGITDNGDGTASFNPATAGAGGPYTITFSYTDGNTCSNSVQHTTTVLANVTAGSVSGTSPLCIGAIATFSTTGATAGGSWSSTNESVATVNASSGLVTAVAPGTTSIVYTAVSYTHL